MICDPAAAITFSSTAQTAPTGAGPAAIAVADFDRDGLRDIATADAGADRVTVLRNAGGAFTTQTTAATGSDPRALAVGDFNRDGLPDLVTADAGSDRVTVLRNTGSGRFTTWSTPGTGDSPRSVAVADFDRDGLPDLATADAGADQVTVLRNNGDATFTAITAPATGDGPVSVAAGDFNRDGRPDLATADSGAGGATVLRNNGDDTFTTVATPAAGADPRAVTVGDFDSDGLPDLAVADAASDGVKVLHNNGDDSFTTLSTPSTGGDPVALARGDFDRDGLPDLATADSGSGQITVLRNSGTSFGSPATPTAGSAPSAVAVADFDRDGRPDLASADSTGNLLTVRLNTTAIAQTNAFVEFATPATGAGPRSVAVADFDRDGLPDLATADVDSAQVTVLRNAGGGAFDTLATAATGLDPYAVAVGDFDRDGLPDVVSADFSSHRVTVLRNTGSGTFTTMATAATGLNPYAVAVADFDRDGLDDIATADFSSNRVTVLRNTGTGIFTLYAVPLTGSRPASVAVGDFDRDGLPDIATADALADRVTVLRNTGTGGFTQTATPTTHSVPFSVAVGDFDRDGHDDLVTANVNADRVTVLRNTGSASFTLLDAPSTGASPQSVAVADFDRDGLDDIVTADSGANQVTVLRNEGAGTFTTLATRGTGGFPLSVAVADFDRDGRPDIATADTDANRVTVQRAAYLELSRAPATLALGTRHIDDGPGATLTATITNTGEGPVTFNAIAVGGADAGQFERLTGEPADCTDSTTLGLGATCELRARFNPNSTGAKSAALTVDSDAADRSVALTGTGTGPELGRSPGMLAFGTRDLDDGPGDTLTSTVTNIGTQPVVVTAITLDGSDAGEFSRLTGAPTDCTSTSALAIGATCDLRVRFDPAATGPKIATLTVASNAADITVGLGGTGIQIDLTPAALAFGARDIDDGPSAFEAATVTNNGTQAVAFSELTLGGGDPGQFGHLTGEPGDCTSTTTLEPGQVCDLRARFDPLTTGAKSATLTLASDGAAYTLPLTGTGTQTELSRSPVTLAFGERLVDDGPTASQTSTISNSGTEPVTLTAITLAGADPSQFARLTGDPADCAVATILATGQTCKLRGRFDPTSPGAKSATLTVGSNAADVVVALTGTGKQPELTPSPPALAFGSRDIDDGPTAIQTSTVANGSGTPITLSAIAFTGSDPAQFERVTGDPSDCTATTTIAPAGSCSLRVRFDPSATGAKSATLTVSSGVADVVVSLTGTGTQTQLARSPATLTFGPRDIDDGPTGAQTATISNSGTEPVTISAVAVGGTDAGQFARLTGAPADCTSTTTLSPGQTCELRARFDPSATGAKSATISVSSNAPDATVALTATGTQTELSRSPATLAFGPRDIDDGPGSTLTATITNSGTEPAALAGLTLTGSDAAAFTRLTGAPADCTATTALDAGQTCDLRMRFDPSSTGSKSATLTVASVVGDLVVSLTGTGTQTELSRGPATLAFGSRDVDDGPTVAQTSTVTNTGTEPVTLSALTLAGGDAADFERLTGSAGDCTTTTTLAAGQTCDLRVRFDPAGTGAKSATLTVASNAADVAVALTGTGTQTGFYASTPTLAFGSRDIDDGPTAAQTSAITNSGSEPVTITSIALTGDAGEFARVTGAPADCTSTTTLSSGQTCDLRARLDPTAVGAKSATLTVATDAGDVAVALTGTGTQTELSRGPATLAFGSQDIDDGPTPAQTATVTNSGTEPVTLTAIVLAGGDAAQFTRLTGAAADCTSTTTLAAGQTCDLRGRFDAASTGAKSATLTVTSNAADVAVALTGTGTQTVVIAPPPPPPVPPPPPPPAPGTGITPGTGSTTPVLCEGRTATIVAKAGQTTITGTAGADVIAGTDAGETIDGGGGDDTICAGAGDDTVRGGAGADLIRGGAGKDKLFGDVGNDTVRGDAGNDSVRGGAGKDKLFGDVGNDTVRGDAGNDSVRGGAGKDKVFGDAGNDTVKGDAGNDSVQGGAGRDRADCGAGRDSARLDGSEAGRGCESVRRGYS